jgi:hypothetical protein
MLPGQGPRPNTNDSSGKRVLRELQNRSLMQRPMTPRAETWIRCSRLHARENEKQVASKPEAAPMEIRTGDLGTGNRDESQLSWTDEKRRVETELVCLHAGQEAADHRTKRAETRGNEKRTQALERPRRKENQRQKRNLGADSALARRRPKRKSRRAWAAEIFTRAQRARRSGARNQYLRSGAHWTETKTRPRPAAG